MTNKFNPGISIIRVLAMISIIVGHWMTMKSINHYQFGAIGVQIFLFISGWLQTNKVIDDVKKWLSAKWKRIILPFYIGLLLLIVIRMILHFEVELKKILPYLFNIQGIGNILKNINIIGITGYGHTWFLTVLVVCYLLTILLKRVPPIEQWIRKNIIISLVISFYLQIIFAFAHIQIGGILCYFYGYYFNHTSLPQKNKYSILTVSVIMLTALRFIGHKYFDNTVFYDNIIFTWSFNLLGIWLSISTMKLCIKFGEVSSKLAMSKIWRILDFYSYPLFLAHYMFLKGELSVEKMNAPLIIQVSCFIVLSFLVATAIAFFSDKRNFIDVLAINGRGKSNESDV